MKRFLALMLALVLVLGCLTACNKKKTEEGQTQTEDGQKQTEEGQTQTETNEVPKTPTLVGTWYLCGGEGDESVQAVQTMLQMGVSMVMAFNEDGTGSMKVTMLGEVQETSFTYTTENGKLMMTPPESAVEPATTDYILENGSLHLTIDGKSLIFTDDPAKVPQPQGEIPSIVIPDMPVTAIPEEPVTVAIVVAGTFGDRSFYDSSKAGGERLAADYPFITVQFIECNNENHTVRMQNAAGMADIVVCVGWEFYDIETVAPEYPEVKFIWIDNETEGTVDNVLNIVYAQNEGSFLAGYIAAAMSKTGVVGAVGGEDSITINDFIVGYKQGAAYFNEATKVEVNYTNDYDDPAKGKDCAKALHDRGADVIFQIASKAGDGVFEAAQEGNFYAIGVDSDQKYINDDVIICSMKKEVGNSIYDAIVKILSGDAYMMGSTWIADMSNGYVDIGYGEDGSTQQIPDELKAAVEELKAKIVSGEIHVDTTRN